MLWVRLVWGTLTNTPVILEPFSVPPFSVRLPGRQVASALAREEPEVHLLRATQVAAVSCCRAHGPWVLLPRDVEGKRRGLKDSCSGFRLLDAGDQGQLTNGIRSQDSG